MPLVRRPQMHKGRVRVRARARACVCVCVCCVALRRYRLLPFLFFSGGLTDAAGVSSAVRTGQVLVNGTFGAASIPFVTHAAGVDNDMLPGVGVGDVLLLAFSIVTNEPATFSEEAIVFSPPLPGAVQYTWVNSALLALTFTSVDDTLLYNSSFSDDYAVGRWHFNISSTANIK